MCLIVELRMKKRFWRELKLYWVRNGWMSRPGSELSRYSTMEHEHIANIASFGVALPIFCYSFYMLLKGNLLHL